MCDDWSWTKLQSQDKYVPWIKKIYWLHKIQPIWHSLVHWRWQVIVKSASALHSPRYFSLLIDRTPLLSTLASCRLGRPDAWPNARRIAIGIKILLPRKWIFIPRAKVLHCVFRLTFEWRGSAFRSYCSRREDQMFYVICLSDHL